MKLELQHQLAKDFPFMRGNPKNNTKHMISDNYTAFGCECGDGWYWVIRNLCAEITAAYAAEGLEVEIAPTQIKEKYGGLRFYYSSTGRCLPVVDDIICKYEDIAENTCEECGKPGKLRNHQSWDMVRCESCFQIKKQDEYPIINLEEVLTQGAQVMVTLKEHGSLWIEPSEQ